MEELVLTAEEGRRVIGGDLEGYTIVEDTITGNGRWSIHHRVVVQRLSDGKFFESFYSVGATESQDESPYEWQSTADFKQVERKEKMMVVYE